MLEKDMCWNLFHRHLHLAHKAQDLEFFGVTHTMIGMKYSNSNAWLREILLQKRKFITLSASVRGPINNGKEKRAIEKRIE